jgi:DNA-binding CsgD family transcriptional regulator
VDRRTDEVPGPKARRIRLPPRLHEKLQRVERLPTASARSAKRARIVLLAARGLSNAQIARLVGMTEKTVRKWRGRMRPHRVRMWLDSPDPDFRRKVRNGLRLVLRPSEGRDRALHR